MRPVRSAERRKVGGGWRSKGAAPEVQEMGREMETPYLLCDWSEPAFHSLPAGFRWEFEPRFVLPTSCPGT